MPSLGLLLATAVTNTMLSPQRTVTEPVACFANFPVSIMICLPPISADTR